MTTNFSNRTNFYDDWIMPMDPIDADLALYWPTDEEFEMIFQMVANNKDYKEYSRQLLGDDLFWKTLSVIHYKEQYGWLCHHLQEHCFGYRLPLTSEIILESLKEFEREVAYPRLIALA